MDALDILTFPPLSQEAIDVVFGTLMGDASLSFAKGMTTAAYVYDLSMAHKDIVELVAGILSAYVINQPAV